MMTPITKMSVQVASIHLVPSLIREAFRLALEERPGTSSPPPTHNTHNPQHLTTR